MLVTSANNLPLDCGAIVRRIASDRIFLENRPIRRPDIVKFNIPEALIDFLVEAELCTEKNDTDELLFDQDFSVPLSPSSQEKITHFLSGAGFWRQLYGSGALKFSATEETDFLVRYNLYPQQYAGLRNLLTAFGLFEHLDSYQSGFRLSNLCAEIVFQEIRNLHRVTRKRISPESLENQLARNKEYGDEAEKFVLEFEKARLQAADEGFEIIHTAKENTAAGYDIESFQTPKSKRRDCFIEVKSVGDTLEFYLSRNEVQVAEELGDEYFLYLVQRSKMGDEAYEPKIIQNPFKKIFQDNDWFFRPESYKIMPGK